MEKQLDELPKIADTLDRIHDKMNARSDPGERLEWWLVIIVALLALILWRVW